MNSFLTSRIYSIFKFIFVFALIGLSLDVKSKPDIDGCWISVGDENKIFCFNDSVFLRISWEDGKRIREYTINIFNDKIAIYHEEKLFVTYLLEVINDSKIVLYNNSKEPEFVLLKGNENVELENLNSFISGNSFRCSAYNQKKYEYKTFKRSEFLSNLYKNERTCYLEYSIVPRFEDYGLELRLKENGVWSSDSKNYFVSVIVKEILKDSIIGYNIEDGNLVVFNEIKESEEYSIIKDINIAGQYHIYKDKNTILDKLQKKTSTIHLGYSRYTLNDDQTYEFDDKSYERVTSGKWKVIRYKKKEYLEFEEINQITQATQYTRYYELIEIDERYLIIREPLCELNKEKINIYKRALLKMK